MNFELTKEQTVIQKMTRDFAQNVLLKDVIENDESSTFPIEAYYEMGKMGLIGLPYASTYDGQDGDYLSYVLALEEISKVDASMGIAYSVCTSLFAGAMTIFGTEEQKKKYLPPVLRGEKLGSFGLTEPEAGSDAGRVRTVADKDGDDYIINGSKCFITNGPISDYFLVIALTDKEAGQRGLSAFIVEKGMPGFSIGKIENKCGIRAAQVSELYFENCRVPKENRVAEEGMGFKISMKTLDGGRIGVAAQGLGIAEGAFDIAKAYMKKRIQFGKPLYKNQYLAFRMAEMEVQIEQAKYMLYKAAMDKNDGKPYTLSAAKAKLVCTNAAMEVTTEAVQMLGGNGFMKEYHVERMMRDAKITQIYEGTNEIQKMIISGDLFRK